MVSERYSCTRMQAPREKVARSRMKVLKCVKFSCTYVDKERGREAQLYAAGKSGALAYVGSEMCFCGCTYTCIHTHTGAAGRSNSLTYHI